jgi:hypothetical protein
MVKRYSGIISILVLSSLTLQGQGRWSDFTIPSMSAVRCYISLALFNAWRAYQTEVASFLALQGDPVAIEVWQELLTTYDTSELLCMMGGESITQIAAALQHFLPTIMGLPEATRQLLNMALYQSLQTVRERIGQRIDF